MIYLTKKEENCKNKDDFNLKYNALKKYLIN